MSVIGMGFVELVILVGLGGGMGLPLGVPPAAEDPLMAKVAPEECLFYTTWAGMAAPDPNSSNQTEQLLAEPEVQHLIAEVKQRIKTGLRDATRSDRPDERQVLEDVIQWVETLLSSPTAVFISGVKPPPRPDVQGGALVRVGEDAAKVKAKLEQYQMLFLQGAAEKFEIGGDTFYRVRPDPDAPVITWGVKKNYLLVGVGEGAVEGILQRARTPIPDWLANLRGQLPVDRTATVTYLNVKKIVDTVTPIAPPEVRAGIDALGLDNVTALSAVTGLDKEGFVSRMLLGLEGEPRGLLQLVSDKPLRPDELAPIPRDATIALAARIDAGQILETLVSVIEKLEPDARRDFDQGVGEIERELGISLRADVLQAVGDAWCVYNSPGEGGLVITGLTGVVPVKDRDRLLRVHEKLLAVLRQEMGQYEGGRRGPRIEQFKFAGQDVYFFNARDNEFPLAPAWCLTEKALIVAPMPQNVKAYLLRGADHQSLAAEPAVAGLLRPDGGAVAMSYVDTRKLFELVYPFVPMVAQVAMSELAREGIDVDVSILPSAGAIGKHLRPAVTALRRTADGIEVISRQSVPGGSVGSSIPLGAALLLPAVSSARGAAKRAQSANNLKQIGLALHNHHEAHGAFPPACSTDPQGKPLLSWRVQILPFVEAGPLSDQFHLDEPWDSEHNKKLIPAMPDVFKAPGSNAGPGMTSYLTVRGENTAFPGKEKIRLADIRDGSSNTIMVVAVSDAKAVPWTKPDDFEYDADNPLAGLVGLRPGGFNALFCDGSVHFIGESIDTAVLKALFTRNGGEVVPPRDF